MTQSSLLPERALMKAIWVEAMLGSPPESLLTISSADLCVRRVAAVDLADNGLGGRIAHVKHPGGDRDLGGGFREIAEGDEVGVDGHVGPGEIAKFGRLRRRLRGIKAGRDQVENAGEGQVVADDLSEHRDVGLGRIGAGSEVGNGDAGLIDPETGASAEPTLFLLGEGEDWGA